MSRHVAARLEATATAEEAVRGADLSCSPTSSPTPVIDSAWVADGAHVVSVGACRPDQREMAPELVARGRLFVDSRAAALVESGDVVQGITEQRFDEVARRRRAGRGRARPRARAAQTPDQITIFKSLGMAVEDVVTADLVLRRRSRPAPVRN